MTAMQYVLQIILAVALITVIILQSRGTGLGSTFAGSGTYHSRRGVEKSLFVLTFIFALSFLVLSTINAL